MDTDSDGQISVAELIAWVKKNSEQVGLISGTFICFLSRKSQLELPLDSLNVLVLEPLVCGISRMGLMAIRLRYAF